MKSQFESHGNLLFSFFIKYIFIISTIFNFQGSDNPSKHLRSPLTSNEERNSRLALEWFKNITFPILVWSKVDAVFIYWQLDWKLQIQYDRCKASGNSFAKLNYFVEEIFNWNFSFYRPEFLEFEANNKFLCYTTASRMGLSQADNYKLSSVSGVRQSPMFAMFVWERDLVLGPTVSTKGIENCYFSVSLPPTWPKLIHLDWDLEICGAVYYCINVLRWRDGQQSRQGQIFN